MHGCTLLSSVALHIHTILIRFFFHSVGKSLPVHCVVESVCTLEEPKINQAHQWRRRPVVETDSFVIIPINTPFQELVQAALHRLGYPSDSVASARGTAILIPVFVSLLQLICAL